MYKYLMERLETAYLDPKIDKLVFIPAEAVRGEYPSDDFEDFMECDTEDILETLHWDTMDKIREKIDSFVQEKMLAFLMATHQRAGFLAEVSFDQPQDFSFDESGEACSWVCGGFYYLRWIYADSIGELIENIIKEADALFATAVKKAKAENKISSASGSNADRLQN